MTEVLKHQYAGDHPMSPLVASWLGKLQRAREMKQPWQDIADECMQFFAGSCGFLWDDKYKFKFWRTEDGAVKPKFQVTINKAFELVALFGPTLYWQNPVRQAVPREPFMLPEEMLAELQQSGDPMLLQQYQMLAMQSRREMQLRKLRAGLIEPYLNWTPYELNLPREAMLAITEALIKGRGCLMSQPYRPPQSDSTMVGSWWVPVDDLLVDPDATRFEDAWWIAVRMVEPVWTVERRLGYKPGQLKPSAQFESANTQGELYGDPEAKDKRRQGKTQDYIQYWRIWSRCGAGGRLSDIKVEWAEKLNQVAGDYCYLEIAENTPFPLNMPSWKFTEATNEEVARAFQWPTPHYRDGKWPVVPLDFYPNPGSPWPIAPLAPALGELKVINVFLAHLCNRIWMSSRDFLVVLESARAEVEKELRKGEDLSMIFVSDVHDSIEQVVKFLQHPPTNMDAFKIVEWFFDLFERRTGLSEAVYGIQQKQSRSATDSQIRYQQTTIRPDDMAKKVERWMTEVVKREALEIKWNLTANDVRRPLGATGAFLWRQLIDAADVERIIHDIDFRLEAGTARLPNRQQDIAVMSQMMPIALPVAQGYASVTGNFAPVEWLLRMWFKKMDLDNSGLHFPPPQPPPEQTGPSPEEQQKLAAEQNKMQMEQEQHVQRLWQQQQEHQLRMMQRAQEHQQRLQLRRAELAARRLAKSSNGRG